MSRAFAAELPWIAGIALGLVGLWWRGHAFVPLPFPSSYDWMEYFPSAWMITHGVDLGGYATWRNPLYPAILGGLGEWIGYNEASWMLGSMAMSLVVISAGLGARAMANPWAGAVAAVTVPFINPWAEASRWATLYPTLAAMTGLSLASAAAYVRWRHPIWILLGGLAAGLAWGVDFRGISLVCAVLVLGLVGMERRRAGRPWGLLLLVLSTAAAGPLVNQAIQISETKETAYSVQTQRELELRLAVESGQIDLVRACRNEVADSAYPTLQTLVSPCAWAFVADNMDRAKDQAPFGVGLTLLLLPLVGLGRSWRECFVGLAVFGAAYGSLFLMAVWARLNVHHFVQFAAPIAMTVPVAIARLVDVVPRIPTQARSLGHLALGIVGLYWVTTQGPWAGKAIDDLAKSEQHRLLGWMLDGMGANIDLDGGDVVMDCTGLGIEAALLPKRTHSGHPNFQPSAQSSRCQSWLYDPPRVSGRVFVFTRQEAQFNGPPQPPWQVIQAWEDGPRRTWLWQMVDTPSARP